ncbi:hypothetical protein [Aquisalimonas sp.]|uniref:hypothetical protein n=1 Tax=Aquisalimonas sp. TaxID=1872621 RepID=UPI0025C2CA23|nr:hypothetical protein [Aquisalimonas sp.]
MFGETIRAVREALTNSERVAQLGHQVSEQTRELRGELDALRHEHRDLRDRVSRIEGSLEVLGRFVRQSD